MPEPTSQSPRHWLRIASIAALLHCTAPAIAANAQQCSGDCNGDGQVLINELITAVGIALNPTRLSECPPADVNGDQMVIVNELVLAVNRALSGGCGASPTPTLPGPSTTATATATESGTATPTTPPGSCPVEPPVPASCGNGRIELPQGETCDDGGHDERPGDPCPANCRILACARSGASVPAVTADIVFDTDPSDLLLSGLTVFVRYPDGRVDVPGSDADAAVQAAVSSDAFSITPNDSNYALTAVLIDPFLFGVGAGTAMTVRFDVCCGDPPPASAFTCRVTDAADLDFTNVTDQVTCRVELR